MKPPRQTDAMYTIDEVSDIAGKVKRVMHELDHALEYLDTDTVMPKGLPYLRDVQTYAGIAQETMHEAWLHLQYALGYRWSDPALYLKADAVTFGEDKEIAQ